MIDRLNLNKGKCWIYARVHREVSLVSVMSYVQYKLWKTTCSIFALKILHRTMSG